MRVVISCAGRFHSYYMADQFNQKGCLDLLITSYPKFEVVKYGVPKEKIKSILSWELLSRAWNRLAHAAHFNPAGAAPFLNEWYDRRALQFMPDDADIFIGWSSKSERCIGRAKANGQIAILERGSSHITVQTEILKEEYASLGISHTALFTPREVIEKELREYELADYISVPSSFAKRSFLEKGISEDKIIQNAYGVNLAEFEPGEKKDHVFRIIYAGQMSVRKGIHYLVKAFKQLNLPNAELMLIGPMAPEIKPLMRKHQENIKYLGPKPQAQLKQFYQQGSVFAICSVEEGMAMVQAQAMACGLPLICTTNTGGEDLIRDGTEGFVLPIRDTESLKQKLEWMYRHPSEAKEMGRQAVIKVSQGYSWQDYADRHLVTFSKFLNKRQSGMLPVLT